MAEQPHKKFKLSSPKRSHDVVGGFYLALVWFEEFACQEWWTDLKLAISAIIERGMECRIGQVTKGKWHHTAISKFTFLKDLWMLDKSIKAKSILFEFYVNSEV